MAKNRHLDLLVITTNTQQRRRDNHAKHHPTITSDTFHTAITDEQDLVSLRLTELPKRILSTRRARPTLLPILRIHF